MYLATIARPPIHHTVILVEPRREFGSQALGGDLRMEAVHVRDVEDASADAVPCLGPANVIASQ